MRQARSDPAVDLCGMGEPKVALVTSGNAMPTLWRPALHNVAVRSNSVVEHALGGFGWRTDGMRRWFSKHGDARLLQPSRRLYRHIKLTFLMGYVDHAGRIPARSLFACPINLPWQSFTNILHGSSRYLLRLSAVESLTRPFAFRTMVSIWQKNMRPPRLCSAGWP